MGSVRNAGLKKTGNLIIKGLLWIKHSEINLDRRRSQKNDSALSMPVPWRSQGLETVPGRVHGGQLQSRVQQGRIDQHWCSLELSIHHSNKKDSQPSLAVCIVCDFFSRTSTSTQCRAPPPTPLLFASHRPRWHVSIQRLEDTQRLFRANGHDC